MLKKRKFITICILSGIFPQTSNFHNFLNKHFSSCRPSRDIFKEPSIKIERKSFPFEFSQKRQKLNCNFTSMFQNRTIFHSENLNTFFDLVSLASRSFIFAQKLHSETFHRFFPVQGKTLHCYT